jgi:hypothetical protein
MNLPRTQAQIRLLRIPNQWGRWSVFGVWISCLLLSGCQSSERQTTKNSQQITPAFYHWKSTYNPTRSEIKLLNQLNINKLYVHFFDVDWDARTHQPVPKALVTFRQKPLGSVVPVVFITNRTLLNMTAGGLPELAKHITDAITRISKKADISYREVQFDCDWSGRTHDVYFQLLTLLSNKLNCPLSATIRLHQIKYADQTGIPPVARGMLMLYNVADWKRVDIHNSIYDPAVVDSYLPFVATYKLPLDAVMPLFYWTVVYRANRFLTFLNNVDRKSLTKAHFLTAQADSNRFTAVRDTTAFGFSVRRGDAFRAEAVSSEMLLTEQSRLLDKIRTQRFTFALYHLDSTILANYPRESLQTLLRPLP